MKAKPKAKKAKKKPIKKMPPLNGYVTIKARGYGNKLKGIKVYYEGGKPSGLKKDGSISFGKAILELLKKNLWR